MKTMTTLRSAALLAGLAAVLSACPKRNTAGDAGLDAAAVDAAVAVADAAAPADPTAGATNISEVARFPDEVSQNAASVTIDATEKVHASPGGGTQVATLSKGTSVTEVSTHGTYALIVFPDPKNASSNLLGWIPESAFGAAHAATHNVTSCPNGESLILGGKANFCAQICTADKDCKPNQACKGPYDVEGNKGGAQVNICVAASAPAPTPAPTVPPSPTSPTPAPTTPPASQPAYIANPGAGNSCASGFSYMSDDKKCHKSCAAAGISACGDPRAFCVNHLGAKVCWATRI